MRSIKVAILGGRGMVGQWFIKMLEGHPMFKLTALTSGSRAGTRYSESVKWLLGSNVPGYSKDITLLDSNPKYVDADIVFSSLPSDIAGRIEAEFAREGFIVISKASYYRMEPDVPLIVPEVNFDHMALVEVQKRRRDWDGAIVTDPNCTTSILALPLKPLDDAFGLKKIVVTTMQSVSGAGYPGVPSYEIMDNIVPYIPGEEDKIRLELRKILSEVEEELIRERRIDVVASCTRVPVLDGHLGSVYIESESNPDLEEVIDALRNFKGPPQELKLPSAPEQPIVVRKEIDRPQPRLDRMAGSIPGMSVVVGRVRKVNSKCFSFFVLGHNLVRGAAGSAILLAELLVKEGYVR
ncbi:MAG: aspartate-semialdehyde dehydrogenase [Thermoprotei archaeon]|nr:MAG: aspartate-semialdehyde dehydrogenase [Thermoprotei archaeon]